MTFLLLAGGGIDAEASSGLHRQGAGRREWAGKKRGNSVRPKEKGTLRPLFFSKGGGKNRHFSSAQSQRKGRSLPAKREEEEGMAVAFKRREI